MSDKSFKLTLLIFIPVLIIGLAGGGLWWLRGKFNWTAALIVDNLTQTSRSVESSNTRLAEALAENRMLRAEVDYLAFNRGKPLPRADAPNVILIINDALRADRLGINNPQAFSPNLDRLAKGGFNFSRAVSQAGWTSPSVTTILTGLYPNQHHRYNRHRTGRLKPDVDTLQEKFKRAGYFTAAFVGRNADWFKEMLERGFYSVLISEDNKGGQTIGRVISFLKSRRIRPYFLLVHVYDPHNAYTPALAPDYPPDMAKAIAALPEQKRTDLVNGGHPGGGELISRAAKLNYDRECEELDYQWGRLFNFLRKGPKEAFDYKKDILVFTADHGEEFEFENGYCWHGRSPSIENYRVPLIFRLPGVRPGSSTVWVENRTVFETVLQAAGLAGQALAEDSLLDLIKGRTGVAPANGYCLSEALYKDPLWPKVNETKSLIDAGGFKLDFDTRTKKVRLFDLNADPTEDHDLAAKTEYAGRIENMKAVLAKRTKLNYDYK